VLDIINVPGLVLPLNDSKKANAKEVEVIKNVPRNHNYMSSSPYYVRICTGEEC